MPLVKAGVGASLSLLTAGDGGLVTVAVVAVAVGGPSLMLWM